MKETPQKIRLGKAAFGQGVFANHKITLSEHVLTFNGPRLTRAELPKPYGAVVDHYLQVGPEDYIGPSQAVCDYVNHSCSPNTAIRIEGNEVTLFALQEMEANSELTFDYSTTMDEDEWELSCGCGARECRSKVRDFKKLPREIQQRYIALGAVPAYILEGLK